MTPDLTQMDRETLWRASDLMTRFGAGIYASNGGHLRHLNKLEGRGLLAYAGMGRDIDGMVERDVHIFMITPAGLSALDRRYAWRCPDWRHKRIVYTEQEKLTFGSTPCCLEPYADYVCSTGMHRTPEKDHTP